MDLNIFKPNNEDGAFLAYIKREALSHINTFDIKEHKVYWYDYYKALIELIKANINSLYKNPYNFIDTIIRYKDYYEYETPITEINISENDFEISKSNKIGHHKRSFDIVGNCAYDLFEEKSIWNNCSYILQIRKKFDFINKEVNEKEHIKDQESIFISKGGVINGDYIEYTYFRKKDYDNGKLLVKLPIKIPVAEVIFNNKNNEIGFIYVVDHREPTLKELMEKYNCPIYNNTDIASYKLNLRACKAESKAKKDYTDVIFSKPEVCKRGAYEAIEDNGAICLKSSSGILAKWVDGHVTIYYNLVRYKKINNNYWIWFTGHSLINLKTIYNRGNKNISFIY